MTARPIRLFGDPVLKTRADEVRAVTDSIRALVADMLDTMDAAGGVGLAAPQVGVGSRVLVYDVPTGKTHQRGHLINPEFEVVGDKTYDDTEGCLSIPDMRGTVKRARRIIARGQDVDGNQVVIEASDLLARCIQHEVDHLDGVLYLDRLSAEERRDVMRHIRQSDWFGTLSWSPEEYSAARAGAQ